MNKKFKDSLQGRPSTINTYKYLFTKHIEPYIFKLNWMRDSDEIVRFMLTQWENLDLSKNTKLSLIRVLSKYVKFVNSVELNTRPFRQMLERSEQQREVVTLTADEAKKLMTIAKEEKRRPEFYLVMLLALHAGLRRGEVFGLRVKDIDLINKKIKVCHSYKGPTKNGKSRIVPMSNEIFKAFSCDSFFYGSPLNKDPDKKIFKIFNPNLILTKLCEIIEIPKIKFHGLRHTFASLALTSGVNPKQVSTWLGHSSVSTTLDLYWNLTNEKADLGFLPE